MLQADLLQLHDTYASWQEKNEENGNVEYKLGHEVRTIKERSNKGVVVEWKSPEGKVEDARFDELILACGEYAFGTG